jgi:hypothetical protein
MKQTYLDTVILKVIENSGNDPDLREDFIRRVVNDRLRDIVPHSFFPINKVDKVLEDGQFFMEVPFVDIIAITKKRTTPQFLYLVDDLVLDPTTTDVIYPYDPIISAVIDYMTEDDIYHISTHLKEFDFNVDFFTNNISTYTNETEVSVFFYSLYKDKNGRTVVPSFAERYLEAYGTLRALEVLLNKGLRGRNPNLVPQTRYTIKEMRNKVTREYLSMQREINLLLDKVILKPVNSYIDAAI